MPAQSPGHGHGSQIVPGVLLLTGKGREGKEQLRWVPVPSREQFQISVGRSWGGSLSSWMWLLLDGIPRRERRAPHRLCSQLFSRMQVYRLEDSCCLFTLQGHSGAITAVYIDQVGGPEAGQVGGSCQPQGPNEEEGLAEGQLGAGSESVLHPGYPPFTLPTRAGTLGRSREAENTQQPSCQPHCQSGHGLVALDAPSDGRPDWTAGEPLILHHLSLKSSGAGALMYGRTEEKYPPPPWKTGGSASVQKAREDSFSERWGLKHKQSQPWGFSLGTGSGKSLWNSLGGQESLPIPTLETFLRKEGGIHFGAEPLQE